MAGEISSRTQPVCERSEVRNVQIVFVQVTYLKRRSSHMPQRQYAPVFDLWSALGLRRTRLLRSGIFSQRHQASTASTTNGFGFIAVIPAKFQGAEYCA